MTCANCHEPMIGVQYQGTSEDYDGVSEWRCPMCDARFGRWSGRRLTQDEIEPRYGVARKAKES